MYAENQTLPHNRRMRDGFSSDTFQNPEIGDFPSIQTGYLFVTTSLAILASFSILVNPIG